MKRIKVSCSASALRTIAAVALWIGVSVCFGCDRPTKTEKSPSTPDQPVAASDDVADVARIAPGRSLYLQHCAACHGENGNGNGLAAQFLFPKPRDFRAGRFRLISTTNNVPTLQDLDAVLVRGMPGSAMPPWGHLSKEDRKLLAEEVMRLMREGMREKFIAMLEEEEEEIVEEEVRQFVERKTTPAALADVPELGRATDAMVASGKAIYVKQGCQGCHGLTGKGDGTQQQIDAEGFPTRPRDLTLGLYKGGHDPASVYRRIAIGLPGTPMPGSAATLPPEKMIDLVHYIRSMSDQRARERAVLKRQRLIVAAIDTLPTSGDADQWQSASAVAIGMMPLWWRNDADPDLRVQALHDGESIALRLSWQDEHPDRHAAKTEAFEDAVAVELYRGDAEPFVGMGAPGSPVDVWLWDADRQSPASIEDVNPRLVVDRYPFSETVVDQPEYTKRDGTKRDNQPDVSLPARAAGNQITPQIPSLAGGSGGSSLTSGGPGTSTFRLPANQSVTARGSWDEKTKRWTVVMRRSLVSASPGEGVTLEPGATVSIAFAVWDGAQRDRDGKKLISIWQDLELEQK